MKRRILSLMLLFALLIGALSFARPSIAATTTRKQLKVNNTILDFNEIVYVDASNGDDTTGDGSKSKPFRTVVKGFDYFNENCREGGAIVIKDGSYDVQGLFQMSNHNINNKYNGMKISLLAETMGKVKFTNVGEWMVVENSPSARIKINMYGIIIKSTFDSSGYYIAGDDWINEYYNCVICDKYGGWNARVSNASVKVENSLFIGEPNTDFTKYPVVGTATNCASTTKYMLPSNSTITTSLYNVSIDTDYNITSDGWKNTGIGTNPDGTVANIGVYGGQFAWGSTVEEVANKNILKVVLEVNEELQLSVDDDLSENIKMTWTSSDNEVATVDANGIVRAFKSGNTMVAVTNSDGSYIDYINILVVDDADDLRLAVDLKVGKSCRLTVDDLTNTTKVVWSSMDSNVATISSKGKVTAISEGLTLITATDSDGNVIGQVYVRVRE